MVKSFTESKPGSATATAVSPSLEPGETLEVVACAMVGQFSARKMAAKGLAMTAMTGGMLTVVSRPQKLFLALTDRRLLFLAANTATGRPTTKVVMTVPREALETADFRERRAMLVIPTLVVDLAVAGSDKGLTLTFPAVSRAEGRVIGEALR